MKQKNQIAMIPRWQGCISVQPEQSGVALVNSNKGMRIKHGTAQPHTSNSLMFPDVNMTTVPACAAPTLMSRFNQGSRKKKSVSGFLYDR